MSARLGERVRLRLERELHVSVRSVVARFATVAGPPELPATVVVKAATANPEAVGMLLNELAASRLLSELAAVPPLCPVLHAADLRTPLLVLEDRSTWGCVLRVPQGIATVLDGACEEAVCAAEPGLRDDYARAVSDALARWHVFHVIHRLPEALQGDRPRGPTSLRQQVLAAIDGFAEAEAARATYPALTSVAARVARRLRHLWPAETHLLPYFPAFSRA